MSPPGDKLAADLPNTTRSTAPPVLLPYQQEWIADESPLKVGEKSRRIGLTWAEAADDVLIAAASKTAGGQNVYYIGYNQDMAIEFIEACGMWARAYNYAAGAIDEGFWDDGDEDKHIKTYTIRFPDSGHRIVALSSRPANLRGKQGVVVVDEAAFHDKLDEIIKAALALLIWGGRVRIISTHDGEQNPFNELVNEIRAGKRKGTTHRTTFKEAVADGLYKRVCLRLGRDWSAEAETEWVREVYAFYGDAAREELDVVPSQGGGRYLTRALVEARKDKGVERVVLRCEDSFTHQPQHIREAEVRDWCERELLPRLELLDPDLQSYFGEDFARKGDATEIWPLQIRRDLNRGTPFVVELRNVPFEQQRQVLFYLVDRLPRFVAGAMDNRGNGAYLAEVAQQRYGVEVIALVDLSRAWYRDHMPRFKAAFEDGSVNIPADADIVADMLTVRMTNGVAMVPQDAREKGADGLMRHGDSAIALALALYAAAEMHGAPIDFTPAPSKASRWDAVDEDDVDVDIFGGGAW